MKINKEPRDVAAILWCLLSGLILGCSQPFYAPQLLGEISNNQSWMGFLAFVGYVPLFLLIKERSLKSVFWLSLLAITAQYSIVLYWIYIALHVHGHITPIVAALITLLLAMLMALEGALFFTIGRFLAGRFNFSFLFVAPLALCAYEYFRNFYIFGGFPWGNVGYSVGRVDELLQVASIVGVYGLVFLVGVVNASLAFFISQHKDKNAYVYLSIAITLVIGSFVFGALRLRNADHEYASKIRVALLQGNIPQEIKSAARYHANEIARIYLDLHQQAIDQGAELIVWPESAYPRMLNENITELGQISDYHVASIVGASVYGENSDKGGDAYHAHNSAFFVDFHGKVVKRYDKSHLVPFGEYVPWPMTGMVDKIVPGLGAFLPGLERKPENFTVALEKHLSVGATVCYEGIFPEITRGYQRQGASLLANLTNDAWYGYSSAPYQHLLMYKLRSAETGLPFIRATNSGISAWIDSYGRIRQTLGLFQRGLLVDNVPLVRKKTVYGALGDLLPIFSCIIILFGYVFSVLPVISYIKQREWLRLLVIAMLFALATLTFLYFNASRFATDESARTKSLIVGLFCLLLMIGILSKTRRSRSILLVCGGVIIIVSALLAIFESVHFLFGLAFGLMIYLLAFRK